MGYAQDEMAELHGMTREEWDGPETPPPGASIALYQPMEQVVLEVMEERRRQDKKWGVQDRRPVEYLAILAEEFGEVSQEVVKFTFHEDGDEEGARQRLRNMREELIQTAAVAVAFVECLDRNGEDSFIFG